METHNISELSTREGKDGISLQSSTVLPAFDESRFRSSSKLLEWQSWTTLYFPETPKKHTEAIDLGEYFKYLAWNENWRELPRSWLLRCVAWVGRRCGTARTRPCGCSIWNKIEDSSWLHDNAASVETMWLAHLSRVARPPVVHAVHHLLEWRQSFVQLLFNKLHVLRDQFLHQTKTYYNTWSILEL